MPISKWPSKPSHKDKVEGGLDHLFQLKRVSPKPAVHDHPLPVYHLTLQDIVAHEKVKRVPHKLFSWRYFASDDAKICATGEVEHALPRLNNLTYGSDLRKELDAAEELAQKHANDHEYEPRILRIPALLIEAFWLVPRESSSDLKVEDVIVPYRSLKHNLQVFTLEGFVSAVHSQAVCLLKKTPERAN